MKRIALACAMLSIVYTAMAQKTIKGKIFDKSTNNPLSGATISFPGKGGTKTDANGVFTIECGKTNKITVSFIGYEPYTVDIKNCDEEINIAMTPTGMFMENVEIFTSSEIKNQLYQPTSITKLTPAELKEGRVFSSMMLFKPAYPVYK